MISNVLLVGLGGFIGSIARYLIYVATRSFTQIGFPLGTLIVNSMGCLLVGLLSGYAQRHFPTSPWILLFLSTGFVGGFTTFSAFGLETIMLLQNQQPVSALFNVVLNIILGLGFVWLGRSIS